jgi:hypothetical protein
MRPTACVKSLRAPIEVKTSRFLACSRDSAADGTIDALSLPERDLTHPLKEGSEESCRLFYLKPTASEQKTSEERGAEDHLSVLTESSNRRLGLPRFGFNGDFILADKMARGREYFAGNLSL